MAQESVSFTRSSLIEEISKMVKAVESLPEARRKFFLGYAQGYADGVAAMKAKLEQAEEKKAG